MFVEVFSYDQQLIELGRSKELIDNIEKTIRVLRSLEISEDIIAQKLEDEFQLSSNELEKYLNK